ncbi:MAG: hypothetical protein COA78_23975 [Blastopirellula sp.]|nr:MAG: hypothetical protein COA78_23975 [Blastopirellula sp.]
MIDVPFLSYQELKARAEAVLNESSFSDQFPVEIELILEKDYGMDIIPIPGLQTAFQIDAFISKDMNAVTVDENVYSNRINRYRFTLAHELGHRVLHQEILASSTFESAEEWKHYVTMIPEKKYGILEYQANTFANALLVAQEQLEDRFQEAIDKVKIAGLDPKSYPGECLDYISTDLGKQFQVSAQSIEIRLRKEDFFNQL